MPKRRPNQRFDEVTSGGGADPDTLAEATRRAERRASARVRAAAESTYERAQAAADTASHAASNAAVQVEAALSDDRPVRAARKAGALAGNTVRFFRDLKAEDITAQVKSFVRRHPSALAGAVVAGFFTGRLLRR